MLRPMRKRLLIADGSEHSSGDREKAMSDGWVLGRALRWLQLRKKRSAGKLSEQELFDRLRDRI